MFFIVNQMDCNNFKNKYIASVGYYADVTSPIIFKTISGSCVGVVLFDCEAGFGGLMHLLVKENIYESQ